MTNSKLSGLSMSLKCLIFYVCILTSSPISGFAATVVDTCASGVLDPSKGTYYASLSLSYGVNENLHWYCFGRYSDTATGACESVYVDAHSYGLFLNFIFASADPISSPSQLGYCRANDGYPLGTLSMLKTVSSLVIVSPKDKDLFRLSEVNFRATPPVMFQANPGSNNVGVPVLWTSSLEYQTSGARGAHSESESFNTIGIGVGTKTYDAIGGKLTVKATATINGILKTAGPNIAYVTGVSIPNSEISARLVALYGGITSRLMTGVAMKESTYRQFATRMLYEVSALWPLESYDGGSHIGLMMMTSKDKANIWNWLSNTQNGINLFKIQKALTLKTENKVIALHPGLRQLTEIERENMGLVRYGPYASPSMSQQYYIPIQNAQNSWDWAINIDGNAEGVLYADSVRHFIQ